jgi:hypothetical protein
MKEKKRRGAARWPIWGVVRHGRKKKKHFDGFWPWGLGGGSATPRPPVHKIN